MSYRVGIVGCGGIAAVHAESLKRLPDVTLTAYADIRPERSSSFAERYGGHAYGSLDEMFEKEELEVLHICTPHALHVPMACAAADRGIRVFMEKPAAVNKEQMDELVKAADKVPIGVCFQNRYNDNVRYVKKELEEGLAGKVLGARAFVTWHRTAPYYTESGWRGTVALEGGGALINQAIHTLDLLTVFLGNPKEAEASMANHHLKSVIEVEDTVEAYIRFEGSTVNFYATTSYCTDAPVLLELVCEKKEYRLEGSSLYVRENKEDFVRVEFDKKEGFGKSYWGTGHLACITNYYNSLKKEEEYQIRMADVERTMNLMFAIYRSAKEDAPVKI